jgi:hypothetical protein
LGKTRYEFANNQNKENLCVGDIIVVGPVIIVGSLKLKGKSMNFLPQVLILSWKGAGSYALVLEDL